MRPLFVYDWSVLCTVYTYLSLMKGGSSGWMLNLCNSTSVLSIQENSIDGIWYTFTSTQHFSAKLRLNSLILYNFQLRIWWGVQKCHNLSLLKLLERRNSVLKHSDVFLKHPVVLYLIFSIFRFAVPVTFTMTVTQS